jgi:type IV secretory pathway TrbD component
MRQTSVPVLILIALLAAVFGAVLCDFLAGRGMAVPVAGWLTGLVLLALSAVLLFLGVPLRRYMKESEQRQEHPTSAPRRRQLDMPTAYRTVLLARACAWTGGLAGGFFAGQEVFLLITGTGDVMGAQAPTIFAAVSGILLGVLGLVVEHWGKLPPAGGEDTDGVRSPTA